MFSMYLWKILSSKSRINYSWNLISSTTFSKTYQAQFSTQVLYIWDRYTIEDGNTYDRRSVYGHSWDEEDWNDGYATIDAVGDDTFDYCAKYQQSYTNNTTFKTNLLNSAFDSLVKKFDISKITYETSTTQSITTGGNHTSSGTYTSYFIWGTISHINSYPDDPNGYIYIIPSSPISPTILLLEISCSRSSSNKSYSTNVYEYYCAKIKGDYIDYIVSSSSSEYPIDDIFEDYWYTRR